MYTTENLTTGGRSTDAEAARPRLRDTTTGMAELSREYAGMCTCHHAGLPGARGWSERCSTRSMSQGTLHAVGISSAEANSAPRQATLQQSLAARSCSTISIATACRAAVAGDSTAMRLSPAHQPCCSLHSPCDGRFPVNVAFFLDINSDNTLTQPRLRTGSTLCGARGSGQGDTRCPQARSIRRLRRLARRLGDRPHGWPSVSAKELKRQRGREGHGREGGRRTHNQAAATLQFSMEAAQRAAAVEWFSAHPRGRARGAAALAVLSRLSHALWCADAGACACTHSCILCGYG